VHTERHCSRTAGQFSAGSDNKYSLLNKESKCYAKYGYLCNFVVMYTVM
jgi:hypothetical protein